MRPASWTLAIFAVCASCSVLAAETLENNPGDFSYQSEFGGNGQTRGFTNGNDQPFARPPAEKGDWDTDLSWDRPVTPLDPRLQGNIRRPQAPRD